MQRCDRKKEEFFHITWFNDPRRMNLRDPRQKREWLQMVLRRGTTQDIQKLNLKEVRRFLPRLNLPPEVKALWQNYFSCLP